MKIYPELPDEVLMTWNLIIGYFMNINMLLMMVRCTKHVRSDRGVTFTPLKKDSSRIQNYVLIVILSYHILCDTGHPILTVVLVISIITWECIKYYKIKKRDLRGVDGAAAVITPDNLALIPTCHIPVIPGMRWAGDGLATTRTPDAHWKDWLT